MRKLILKSWPFFGIGFVMVLTMALFAFGKDARTIRINDSQVAKIYIRPGKTTVLNFPSKPSKVILGAKNLFSVEYVENDLAIAALTSSASSNLFVYLQERRFAFDLQATPSGTYDSIIHIRDAYERQIKVDIK